jgi:hypothetical protein
MTMSVELYFQQYFKLFSGSLIGGENIRDMKFNRPFKHYWFDSKIIRFFNTLFYMSCFPTMTKMVQVQQKRVRIIVFNVTFNNISAILWWSVLLVEEK